MFLESLRPGRPRGIDALIEHTRQFLPGGAADRDDPDDPELDEWWARHQARRRARAVGGVEQLLSLDTEPLPIGEVPRTDHLDPSVRAVAAEVAASAARVAGELYGPTICWWAHRTSWSAPVASS